MNALLLTLVWMERVQGGFQTVKKKTLSLRTGSIRTHSYTISFLGMTIDTDGNLYVATWGGSKVLKINPE